MLQLLQNCDTMLVGHVPVLCNEQRFLLLGGFPALNGLKVIGQDFGSKLWS
jgi:hypothetical protein